MGEDQVEYWLEQARVMVEGSDCPEREKRRRIMESLRGPALEIIRSLRFSNPEASSDEYISAIDKAFGSPRPEKICTLHIVLFSRNLEKCYLTICRDLNLFWQSSQKGGLVLRI